jgi:hypothetical protein
MGILGKLVDIGCAFDWIGPSISAVDSLRGGKGLAVSATGTSGAAIVAELKRYGIHVRRGTEAQVNGYWLFNVAGEDYDAAKSVLRRAGYL